MDQFAAAAAANPTSQAIANHENILLTYGPSDRPFREAVKVLNREIVRAITLPDSLEKIGKLGFAVVGASPEVSAALFRSESAKWSKVIGEAGNDPAAIPPFPGEAFGRLYGLTNAELRVVLALASGVGLQKIASEQGVTMHTIRTHLKHVFQKTYTCRQADLMALILRLAGPARFADSQRI